jgi:hypothetical protein
MWFLSLKSAAIVVLNDQKIKGYDFVPIVSGSFWVSLLKKAP